MACQDEELWESLALQHRWDSETLGNSRVGRQVTHSL